MLEPMPWARALLLVAVALFAAPGCSRDAPPAVAEVRIDELPVEARQTLEQIRRGGPYDYRKDGAVFGNREKRLPARPRGYYTEYTVRPLTRGTAERGGSSPDAAPSATRRPAASTTTPTITTTASGGSDHDHRSKNPQPMTSCRRRRCAGSTARESTSTATPGRGRGHRFVLADLSGCEDKPRRFECWGTLQPADWFGANLDALYDR